MGEAAGVTSFEFGVLGVITVGEASLMTLRVRRWTFLGDGE